MTNEQKAIEIGNNKSSLLARLKDAKSVLKSEFSKLFKTYTFDFKNKRLISACGDYCLQWDIRDNPNKPACYENQQTSRGTVSLYRIEKKI